MYGGSTALVALGEDIKLEPRVVFSLPYLRTDRLRESFASESLSAGLSPMTSQPVVLGKLTKLYHLLY